MEIIDWYVYGVTKRLLEAQKNDVGIELRGLIDDMLNARVQDREVTEEDVKAVLLELDHPRSSAQRYRGGPGNISSILNFMNYLC